jgi:predicted metal-dependent phosphoesterase TrpH
VSQVDLHIHTTASDGKYPPAEIVRMSADCGLRYIAICDHDSIDGILPAQREASSRPPIEVIAGVEINTDTSIGELHILGYFVDVQNEELKTTLERLRNSRELRAQKMIDKLWKLGIHLEYAQVKKIAGEGSVGRPHIAQAMLEKGYINSFKEAFMKYISRGGPAYVERDKITPAEATQLIIRASGIPALAHPLTCGDPEAIVRDLASAGLRGLEVFYSGYSPEQIQGLLVLADKYNLLATGGSDFHGLDTLNEPPLGSVEVPVQTAQGLIDLARRN